MKKSFPIFLDDDNREIKAQVLVEYRPKKFLGDELEPIDIKILGVYDSETNSRIVSVSEVLKKRIADEAFRVAHQNDPV